MCFLFSTLGAAADELINVTINVPVNWNMTHCSDLGFCNPVNIYTCVHFQAPSYVFPDSMYGTQCLSLTHCHHLQMVYPGSPGFAFLSVAVFHLTQSCRPSGSIHIILKSADTQFCEVFCGLPMGAVPSTINFVCTITQFTLSFHSTSPCPLDHLSLYKSMPPRPPFTLQVHAPSTSFPSTSPCPLDLLSLYKSMPPRPPFTLQVHAPSTSFSSSQFKLFLLPASFCALHCVICHLSMWCSTIMVVS